MYRVGLSLRVKCMIYRFSYFSCLFTAAPGESNGVASSDMPYTNGD